MDSPALRSAPRRTIPGTPVFDGHEAIRGYALNRMCYSFNDRQNREAFKADPDGYCRAYGLDAEQVAAVKSLDVLSMLKAGGNIYYLAKLAGIYGLNVQDIGAQQTGRSLEEFKAMLLAHGAN
jgi:protocatechuate 4,5-dioxygenase, alpha chain